MIEIKQWPASVTGFYEKIDKQDIYRLPYSGIFKDVVSMKDRDVPFLVYIPEGAHHTGPGILLIPDQGDTMEHCLLSGGWKELADRNEIVLFVAMPGQGMEYHLKLTRKIHERVFYNVNKTFCYLVGNGSGGVEAQKLAMSAPQQWSGVVSFGMFEVEAGFREAAGSKPSDVPFILQCQVPMPVWVWTDQMNREREETLAYWKSANRTEAAGCVKDCTTRFLPVNTGVDSLIESQAGAEVRLTMLPDADYYGNRIAGTVWEEFLSKTLRATGIINGDLRPWRNLEQWGADFKTMEVDGYRREWYEYMPTAAKRSPGTKIPLVVCFHGGGNLGWVSMNRTEWIKVAEARNFAVVFPSGSMRRLEQKCAIPHPAWNACGAGDIMDDVKFVKLLMEDIMARCPIDRSRIYANGHSMGACMCQRVALVLPEYFAACAATGGVLRGGFFGSYEGPEIVEDYRMPLWIVMGENDRGGGTYEKNPAARQNILYWIGRNKTQPIDAPAEYVDGIYHHKVYTDNGGVPMVRFTTVDYKPHACTPQDSWFFYDEMFSKFRRDESGNVVYMERAKS